MLLSLVRTYLRPYAVPLAIVVALQFVGTMAGLFLPSINADIIDNGVVTGDTAYIIRHGGLMLVVSLVQIICSVIAVWFSARNAMGFGRDVRAAIFARVGTFSAREVQQFGAPSLITRETNDVQQVQMLVLLAGTLMVSAPIMMIGGIIMAAREDLGLAWLVVAVVPVLGLSIGLIVSRMVPSFRVMQDRIDEVNRLLREQITGVRVVRAFVREEHETERFARRQRRADRGRRPGRALAGRHVPRRDDRGQRGDGRRDVVRRAPRRERPDGGGRADGLHLLPDADRHVGDDGDVHADDGAARRGLRRPHHRGPRHRLVRGAAQRPRHAAPRARRASSSTR